MGCAAVWDEVPGTDEWLCVCASVRLSVCPSVRLCVCASVWAARTVRSRATTWSSTSSPASTWYRPTRILMPHA
eukprot:3721807-Rhodomonas_salina.2